MSHRRDPRAGKLDSVFYRTISGDQEITRPQTAKLFIEAVCRQSDPVRCVQKLISSPRGLHALHTAICSETSLDFLNSCATDLVRYIQAPDLSVICQGEYLRDLIINITEPPTFWDAFIREQKAGRLKEEAVQCFSWLLLQLVSIPPNKAPSSQRIAGDPSILKDLLTSPQLVVRTNAQKIKHILDTITNPDQFQGDGPGGRHDNDHIDIRKISIFATPDELESTDPFLRRASEIDECDASRRLAMHIDNQFRLLREDMIRDLREEIQVARGLRKGRRRGLHIDGLVICGLDYGERQLWTLQLKCARDLPQFRNKTKPDERKKYLSDHRNLFKHQSLACLLANGHIQALVTIHRDEDKLAQKPPTICIQFSGSEESITKALLALKSAQNVELIQLDTAMFAYEPVLLQLQETKQLLLNDEILLWNPEQELRKAPLSEQSAIQHLLNRLEQDPCCELQQLLDLPQKTQLDLSQAKCLIAGLSQRLSSIQGPPGTGKSFIGALIGKAIHKLSAEQILVVCYTNHALDQFLEDLINVGIPRSDIVRLGSSSKASATTQPLILSNQQSAVKPSKEYWNVIDVEKNKAKTQGEELGDSFTDYHASGLSRSDLMEYLEFDLENPTIYDAFVLPGEADGMVRVGRKNKAADKFYLLDRWAHGRDAGIYRGAEVEFPEVWQMDSSERLKLIAKWKLHITRERVSRLYASGTRFNETVARVRSLHSEKDRRILDSKRIIGCTTTAAAKYVQTLNSVSPGVLLVEEAGEIMESHVLTALGRATEQLILIGDHKQLRPKCHYDLSVDGGDGYDLNRSLLERLIIKGYPYQVLSQQHRMRPEISCLIRELTYPNLTDAPLTRTRPNLRGFQDNLVFLSHDHPENEVTEAPELKDFNSTSSKSNDFEANMTLRCVRYLAQQGYRTSQLVVLTPYVAQLRLLFDVLAAENDPVLNDLDSYDLVRAGLMPVATANMQKSELRISTIDNYQGEESDVVLISLTRSNNRGDIGFLTSPERLNVLLSRARDALIIIGNPKTFMDSRKGSGLWSKFLGLLKDGSHIYDGFPVTCQQHPDRKQLLRYPEDFDQCPDGGCSEPCNTALNCGKHSCPLKCHQLSDHSKMECDVIVRSNCLAGHSLSWKCHIGQPAICATCERDRKDKEKKLRADSDRQQRLAQQKKEHAANIAKIEEDIRRVREAAMDDQLANEMSRSLDQKKQDLKDAKRLVNGSINAPVVVKVTRDSAREVSAHSDKNTPSPQVSVVERECTESSTMANTAPSPSEAEWERQKRAENVSNDAIDSLMKMTGLEEVKSQFLKIKARTEIAARQGADMRDERYGTCLLGNPGTGKTTVARLYAKFLTSMAVLKGTEFIETSGSRLASDGVPGAKQLIEKITNAGGGCLFVDEAYQLSSGNSYAGASVLDFLLAEIENQVGIIVFIFAGYNKEMEKFFEHNPGFSSRMSYRLQFSDYSDKELVQILGQRIRKKYSGNMNVEGGIAGLYVRIAVRRLGRGRGREGFGNARALENLLAKVSERQAYRIQHERADGKRPDDFLLKKEDMIGPEPSAATLNSDAWRELQELIGLKAVKQSMQGLLDRIHTNYQRELQEKEIIEVSLNRVFLGSPGTGKTSVGKLYGQVLADLGLLSNGEVVVKNPADFVGSVLGESEKNTKGILKTTEGKVLIIDEAYMLYSGGKGLKETSDPYKTAVVDTIVAEVQSTLGEDRAVLLLGYQAQMEEMFQNMNPGLARRFALDDAFQFEDFDDDQLRQILDLNLRKQGLGATKEAKDVAISVLARARHRPNFGNAGAVQNMISRAKAAHQSRQSAKPLSARAIDVVFEPQDFDGNYDRSANANANCRELFKDVLGCDGIVSKLEGYMQTSSSMRARGLDPREHIPFSFIFKGPPGTGKTTTARKMGQVFYDMGFLSTVEVHECSATDLVAGYVGQTGPKTVQLLEKALGKVLFVDEAYRLGEGAFGTEAVNELVDSLTKPRFMGKIIVILAGYEDSMNELLSVNPGLSSRFSEEVVFANMEPEDCWKLLGLKLKKGGISLSEKDTHASSSHIWSLFQMLTSLPSWGNGRDVETIAKSIINSMYRAAISPTAKLTVSHQQIIDHLTSFLAQRQARSESLNLKQTRPSQKNQATENLFEQPKTRATDKSTTSATDKPEPEPTFTALTSPFKAAQPADSRDPGVTDAIWTQLQNDKAAHTLAKEQTARNLAAAEAASRAAAAKAAAIAKEAEALAKQKAKDDAEMQALKQQREEARLKAVAAQRARDEAEARLREMYEEVLRARREEERKQVKLRSMGVCVAGFQWIRQAGGYRCGGGNHFISDAQLRA